jgi:hypothetical protein
MSIPGNYIRLTAHPSQVFSIYPATPPILGHVKNWVYDRALSRDRGYVARWDDPAGGEIITQETAFGNWT